MLGPVSRQLFRTIGVLAVAALCGPAVSGCGSMRAADADADAPGLTLGSRTRGEAPFSAERAISGEAIVGRYRQYTGGSSRPSPKRAEVRVVPGEDGAWWTERWTLPTGSDREPSLDRRVLLSRGADGSVLLSESSGGEEDLTTLFDPPARMAAALMAPGESIEDEFRIRVLDADGDEVRTGTGTTRIRYAGKQQIETPLGVFDADLLLTDLTIDSGIATIARRQRQWIATVRPGRTMIVAEDVAEQVRVLGFSRSKRHRLAIEAIVR
ncbi:MAG: hypothetical protein AAGF47_03015 [Planctomycetota bacterium]